MNPTSQLIRVNFPCRVNVHVHGHVHVHINIHWLLRFYQIVTLKKTCGMQGGVDRGTRHLLGAGMSFAGAA